MSEMAQAMALEQRMVVNPFDRNDDGFKPKSQQIHQVDVGLDDAVRDAYLLWKDFDPVADESKSFLFDMREIPLLTPDQINRFMMLIIGEGLRDGYTEKVIFEKYLSSMIMKCYRNPRKCADANKFNFALGDYRLDFGYLTANPKRTLSVTVNGNAGDVGYLSKFCDFTVHGNIESIGADGHNCRFTVFGSVKYHFGLMVQSGYTDQVGWPPKHSTFCVSDEKSYQNMCDVKTLNLHNHIHLINEKGDILKSDMR